MTTTDPTTDHQQGLGIARALAAAGAPVFLAVPDDSTLGFRLPTRWQETVPDPGVVDAWLPGMALCLVTGVLVDGLDFDPRHGGNPAQLGTPPAVYGVATTPSGGEHWLIAPLRVGSRNNTYPGIDVKAGLPDGSGRGFLFLAPTVRRSKVTGELGTYRWVRPPDVAGLINAAGQDRTGAALAGYIASLRASSTAVVHGDQGESWYAEFLAQREPQSAAAAERAITEQLTRVQEWRPDSGIGFRQTLLTAAYTLGGYVGGGYLDEQDTRERLDDAIRAVWPAPDQDDRLWIQQGLDDGSCRPFRVFTAEDEAIWSEEAQQVRGETEFPDVPPPPPPTWTIPGALSADGPFDPACDGTDQSYADLVAQRMYRVLRYATDTDQWVRRLDDGHAWEATSKDMSGWIISGLARLMPLGDPDLPDKKADYTPAHRQFLRRGLFMSSAGTAKITRKLRDVVVAAHYATIRVSELDTNPEILWAGSIPWDLRASEDRPQIAAGVDPNMPHLHAAACAPDPRCPTPRWDTFLATVLPDPEVRAYALRVLAVGVTGYPDAAVPILFGRERSGKTSLLELVMQVLGSYAHAADAKLLGDVKEHSTIIYDLRGRRLSFIDEGPKRGHDATERLKQLTGGGSMTARPMNANPITFRPTHTLVMTTNNEPHLTDPALRARTRLIPCDAPEELVRPARAALDGPALVAEAPGILALLMREAAGFLRDRTTVTQEAAPIQIRGLAQDIAEGQDPIRQWVTDCTVPAEPGTQARQLYTLFVAWHVEQPLYRRLTVPSETAFGRVLNDMGFLPRKIDGKHFRPLSVLSGPGTFMGLTPPPVGYQFGTPGPTPSNQGGFATEQGGFQEGSGRVPEQPSGSDQPRSGAVFEGTEGGLEGSSSETVEKIKSTPPLNNMSDMGSETLTLPESLGKQGLTCDEMVDREGCSDSPTRPSPEQPDDDLPTWDDHTRRVTNSDVARRATELGLTKAVARAQLTAARKIAVEAARVAARQQRLDAKVADKAALIATVAGELLELPVAVDRDGHLVPVTVEQAIAVVRSGIARSGALTVDVETSGYPVGHHRFALRTVQLGDAVAVVVFHPVTHADTIAMLFAEAPVLHAHSATADLIPCAHAGLVEIESAWDRMIDTAIPASLGDPAAIGLKGEAGLKALAPAVLKSAATVPAADAARANLFKVAGWNKDTRSDTPPESNGWNMVDARCSTMLRYAAADVLDTAALAKRLPQVPAHVLTRERLAQRMTARVTDVGVALDRAHIAEMTARHRVLRDEAGAQVRAYGVDNPGSDKQVADLLVSRGVPLPRTPGGAPSVAAAVLKPLRDAEGDLGTFVRGVLDYRHADTVLGLFLAPYAEICDHGDGRVRPTIYTLGTTTGRMSCVRPNLQQLSKTGGVRACLTADPGDLIISADFSGVEIRVAAALSQDPTLLAFLREGRDLHQEIADQVWGPGQPDEDRKANRYKAKSIVFGRMYGGGARTLAGQAGVSESIAQSAIDTLDEMLPQLKQWADWVRGNVAAGHTAFPSYSGRIIHLRSAHAALNYTIQGSARELLVDALVRWRDTRWGNRPLLPVHDELLAFVPAEEAQEATAELVACMTTTLNEVAIIAKPSDPSPFWQDAA